MSANPFVFGKPITDQSQFVGRQEEIRQVINRLLSTAHESTSLVGARRMGKTSMLLHLSNPKVGEALGLTPDHYGLVYLDLQMVADDITPQRFWIRVLRQMQKAMHNETVKRAIESVLRQTSFDIFDLDDLFETVRCEGQHVILFLDEFECITQNTSFGADFFGGLRSLAISMPLTLVTSTQCNLEELCHSEEIKSSPFFNIFSSVVLRAFSDEDSSQLLEITQQRSKHEFSQIEKGWVYELGGGYPFFLQMAGYYLFEGKSNGLSGEELYSSLLSNFAVQSNPHFEYFWNDCSESEKISLLTLELLNRNRTAGNKKSIQEMIQKLYPRALQDFTGMQRRGLVRIENNQFFLFSPSLGDWILQELKAMPGDEGENVDFREWLNKNGVKNAEDATVILGSIKKKYQPLMQNIVTQVTYGVMANVAFEMLKHFIGAV